MKKSEWIKELASFKANWKVSVLKPKSRPKKKEPYVPKAKVEMKKAEYEPKIALIRSATGYSTLSESEIIFRALDELAKSLGLKSEK